MVLYLPVIQGIKEFREKKNNYDQKDRYFVTLF